MSEIPTIGIGQINVTPIPVHNINLSIPFTPPVTLQIGSPIVDVPGCVKFNPANKNSIELVNQDERGSRVLCDGSVPWFEPMDYQPENLIYVQEESVPVVAPPPEAKTEQPGMGEIPKTDTEEDVPCPGPTDQRVGDMRNAESREKVVSHSLSPDGKTCITNYELTSPVEKYLPTTSQISTTAAIAVVATAAAASTPILLRLIKPLIKQVIKRIKALLGKKEKKLFSTSARLKKSKILTKVRADDSE